jgi:hypothetical protein
MRCLADAYDYGHAGCCGCERDLDLASEPSGLSFEHGKIALYFFYCLECFAGLQVEGLEACDRAVAEALRKGRLALPDPVGLAMMTSLALEAHGGDLVRAYEIGVEIPRIVHDVILAGEAEAAFCSVIAGEA